MVTVLEMCVFCRSSVRRCGWSKNAQILSVRRYCQHRLPHGVKRRRWAHDVWFIFSKWIFFFCSSFSFTTVNWWCRTPPLWSSGQWRLSGPEVFGCVCAEQRWSALRNHAACLVRHWSDVLMSACGGRLCEKGINVCAWIQPCVFVLTFVSVLQP